MQKNGYETVIGLEIHAELDTSSKIFCGCSTEFGGEANSHCCPICSAFPGTLPLLNEKVIEYAVRAGLALNCEISKDSRFDRKHYFYPDLPKAFQTSQLYKPLCIGGYLDIELENGETKRIRLNRIHVEEDAGKLVHENDGTHVDLNRGACPLIEIVTEPDIRSAEEAKLFFEGMRKVLMAVGVCNGQMQEGSLRCDVNLSVRPLGQEKLGTRTEMKNLNSFASVYRAAEYENKRQIKAIEKGEEIQQMTLRWDDGKGTNSAMRAKVDESEYFYIPEPDIRPIILDDEYINSIKKSLPELPKDKLKRYMADFELGDYDARLISDSKVFSELFEDAINLGADPKQSANFILSDINRLMNEMSIDETQIPIDSKSFSQLLSMTSSGKISRTIASKVLDEMFLSPKDPEVIVEEKGWGQVSDEGVILQMCKDAIAANEKAVGNYKEGNKKALTSLVGHVMKASKGKANPGLVNKLLVELLEK